MQTYPDRNLEYDEGGEGLWGCLCGRGMFGRTYQQSEEGLNVRVECECGLCGPWGDSVPEACFHWNLVVASLTGPYSLVELLYRRLVRLGKEAGKDVHEIEEMLAGHMEARAHDKHQ